MNESITFSEELIPKVVDIIRAGIRAVTFATHKDPPDDAQKCASVALEDQCVELMKYWKRLQDGG